MPFARKDLHFARKRHPYLNSGVQISTQKIDEFVGLVNPVQSHRYPLGQTKQGDVGRGVRVQPAIAMVKPTIRRPNISR